MKRVEPGSFLTLHYRLRDADGSALVDTFVTPPATLSLGSGELAPAMEARLLGLEAGSERFVRARRWRSLRRARPAPRASRQPRRARREHGDTDGDYRVGDVVRFPAPDGQTIAGVVRSVEPDALLFDFNHPLAGRPLTFDVKLIGVL